MLANLLDVAGVDHVITIDLHASQMQGFFKCPVDNLVAEPLLSHWIKRHVRDWQNAVVVSKNPGGTKRVTSLADALKLSFGIIMTDRYRPGSPNRSMDASIMYESGILEKKVSASSPFSESKVKTEDHDLPARPFSRLSRVAEKDMDSAGCSTYSYNRPNDHQVAQDLRLSRAQTAPSTFQDDGSSSEDDELDKVSERHSTHNVTFLYLNHFYSLRVKSFGDDLFMVTLWMRISLPLQPRHFQRGPLQLIAVGDRMTKTTLRT